MKKISIVIPALNEELRLPKTLEALILFMNNNLTEYEHEVIVVVPRGKDNTLEVAKKYKESFKCDYKIVEPGQIVGKGRDVKAGVLSASGDKIIFMDADLATPLYHLNAMLEKINDKTQMCIGIRKLNKMHHSKIRSLVSRLGNLASMILVGIFYEDTQCGFKGFTKEAAKTIFEKQTILGWAFDIELLTIAKRTNIKVSTISIPDWTDVAGGNLTDNVLRSSLNTLQELFKIRLNIMRGKY